MRVTQKHCIAKQQKYALLTATVWQHGDAEELIFTISDYPAGLEWWHTVGEIIQPLHNFCRHVQYIIVGYPRQACLTYITTEETL